MVAAVTFLVLPNNIASATFLSEEERDVGIQRLRGVEHGTGNKERYELRRIIPIYELLIFRH